MRMGQAVERQAALASAEPARAGPVVQVGPLALAVLARARAGRARKGQAPMGSGVVQAAPEPEPVAQLVASRHCTATRRRAVLQVRQRAVAQALEESEPTARRHPVATVPAVSVAGTVAPRAPDAALVRVALVRVALVRVAPVQAARRCGGGAGAGARGVAGAGGVDGTDGSGAGSAAGGRGARGTGARGDTIAGVGGAGSGGDALGGVPGARGAGAGRGTRGGAAGAAGADDAFIVGMVDAPGGRARVDEEVTPQTLGGMLPLVVGVDEQGQFDFDQALLRSEVKIVLDDLADRLQGAEYDRLDIIGFTDRIGTDEYNQQLSERRAWAVARYLMEKGVPLSKIKVEGRGERESLLATSECAEFAREEMIACFQKDRRVQIEASIRKSHVKIE